jgi:hypothetical protein
LLALQRSILNRSLLEAAIDKLRGIAEFTPKRKQKKILVDVAYVNRC